MSLDVARHRLMAVRVGSPRPCHGSREAALPESGKSSTVETALDGVLPEPIHEHFVVINGRRWPPKQVLALVTGLDRADFTTHQARRALARLGFPAGRAARRELALGDEPVD